MKLGSGTLSLTGLNTYTGLTDVAAGKVAVQTTSLASGGVTLEAHEMAVRRMASAGGQPITWMAVMGEWQRDWAREGTVPAVAEILAEHGGGSGIAFAWELQLLATTPPDASAPVAA